jgi:hypothetical protein
MKCNKTQSKWCINKHGASKIIDAFETYHSSPHLLEYDSQSPPVYASCPIGQQQELIRSMQSLHLGSLIQRARFAQHLLLSHLPSYLERKKPILIVPLIRLKRIYNL